MQVTREDISPCLVTLEFNIDAGTYGDAVDRAKKELSKRTEVPGFRKGKAPMSIVERVLDPERVQRLASEYVVPDAVDELLKEQNLDPWDTPSLEKLETTDDGGLTVKTLVTLPPTIELGSYVNLDVERIVRPVTDELIDREIERQRSERTRLEPSESAVENEDYVFVTIQELDEEGNEKGEPANSAAVIGQNVADFDNNVIGMMPNEPKEFTINYPDDWHESERAGSTVRARVTVLHSYKQIKPDLDDEFAKSLGEFETVQQLRDHISEIATKAISEAADEQVTSSILQKILEGSTVHYPPQILDNRFNRRVHELFEQLNRRKLTFEQYLAQTNTTEEEFRHNLERQIDYDIRIGMLLGEIAEKEKIEVSAEEIDEQVSKLTDSDEDVSEQVYDLATSDEGREAIGRRRLTSKVLEFLRGASNIKDVTPSDDEHVESDEQQGD